MFLNHITVHCLSDFQTVIDSPLFISKNNELYTENSFPNMWAISFDSCAIKNISIKDFSHIIDLFLCKKKDQLKQLNNNDSFLFYMWFDEMAAQLRLNIIPDNHKKLSFGCSIKIVPSQETILHDFLSSHYHSGITWQKLEIENNSINEQEEEKPYILKVFVSSIKRSDIQPM